MPSKSKKQQQNNSSNNSKNKDQAALGLEDRDELCRKIDEVFIQYIQTLNELSNSYALLTEKMKDGYFNIGKARIATGGRGITSMQYDNNMTATYLLEEDEEQNLIRRNVNRSESSSSTSSGDSSESTGLRSRKKDGKSQSEEEASTPSTSSSNKIAPKDPLFWFGFLPSQTLRKSQQSFISATNLVVEMANTKRRLQQIENEYHDLLQKKFELDETTQ